MKTYRSYFLLSLLLGTQLQAQTPLFNVTDIGSSLGTNSVAQAINNPGAVVGYRNHGSGASAFLYQSNQIYEIAALGTNANFALSINDGGRVTGYSQTDNGYRAFYFDGNTTTSLGDWGGTNSYGISINASNLIVGFCETTNGAVAVYFDGLPWGIGSLGGTTTYPFGINVSNVIVGAATTTNGDIHAFQFDRTGMVDLNSLISSNGFTLTTASAINGNGVIAGWGTTNDAEQAFTLSSSNLLIIPFLAGATNSRANAINSQGDVTGFIGSTNSKSAFLWRNGTIYDLNLAIDSSSGWVLHEAMGINDAGQIVGWGNKQGEVHAFLLTPNQPPSVSITSPTNGTVIESPANFTLNASASDDVAVTKVEFYSGNQLLATQTTPPYTKSLADIPAGNYVFTAVAYDNLGATTTSAVVNVTVSLPEPGSLKCWLKSDTLGLTNGATVTLWTDSSGNGNNGTSSGSNAPIFLTNQTGGLPAVKFDGTNDYLALPSFLNTAVAAEAFVVLKPDGSSSGPLWTLSTNYSATAYNTTGISDNFGRPSLTAVGSSTALAGFHVYDVSSRSNDWVARVNGTILAWNSNATVKFPTALALGRSATAASTYSYGKPYIAEVLIYNKVLTDSQRISIGKYLSGKYSVATNLTLGKVQLTCQAPIQQQLSLAWNVVSNAASYVLDKQVNNGVFTTLLNTDQRINSYSEMEASSDPITFRLTAKNYQNTTQTNLVTPLMTFAAPANESVFLYAKPMSVVLITNGPIPTKVEIWANNQIFLTQTNSPWGFTVTNTVNKRWNLRTKSFDAAGNSRFSDNLGINVIGEPDSDGDGYVDSQDAYPFDPTRWTAGAPDATDTNAPIITITAP